MLGFKFIGNTALQLSSQGYNVPFAYEEAIGYMFGSQIRDKDGIAATVEHIQVSRIFNLWLIVKYFCRHYLWTWFILFKPRTKQFRNILLIYTISKSFFKFKLISF